MSATAIDAARLGFGTEVLQDAIASVDLEPDDGERALDVLRGRGGRASMGYCFGTLPCNRRCDTADARSTWSTRPTSCSGRTTRRARRRSAGTGSTCRACPGVIDQMLYLLREEGATHVGCATDHVIESFRNDMFAGYKSSAGMPPELLAQFPIAEDARRALGPRRLADGRVRGRRRDRRRLPSASRDDPGVEQVIVCTPDKDMAQLVDDERVVLLDRRRRITYDEAGVIAKWGVPPASIPDWLALVGDSSDGYPGLPGWGAKSAAAVLARYGSLEEIPAEGVRVGRARACAAVPCSPPRSASAGTRRCSTARWPGSAPSDDGVDIPQRDVDELRWDGTPRAGWEAFCDEWGLDGQRSRPHVWAS